MADPARARKLADRIKVVVSETLRTRVKDPRLGFVTITDVRVTGDLQHATVFYTVLGDDVAGETGAALASARGLVRSEVGKQTGIRLTPTVEFVADGVPEAASRIDDLVERVRRRDAEIAALAAAAVPAGDPDPYRKPREVVDEDDSGEDDSDEDDLGDPDEDHTTGG